MGLWLISSSSSFKKKVGNIQRVSKEFLLNSSSAGFGDLCLLLSGRMILFFFSLWAKQQFRFPIFFLFFVVPASSSSSFAPLVLTRKNERARNWEIVMRQQLLGTEGDILAAFLEQRKEWVFLFRNKILFLQRTQPTPSNFT